MTEKKPELKDLKCQWERAQIARIIAPVFEGVRVTPEISDTLLNLEKEELAMVAETLWHDYVDLNDSMVCKKTVARMAGMTVSWLDNSDSEKARKLRAIGVRYGTGQTSPVRFQRSRVQEICRQDEITFPNGI